MFCSECHAGFGGHFTSREDLRAAALEFIEKHEDHAPKWAAKKRKEILSGRLLPGEGRFPVRVLPEGDYQDTTSHVRVIDYSKKDGE